MIHKQITIILTAIVFVLGFSSCKKNTKPFVGEYTYQTDGKITITLATEDVDIPWTGLGQMQILKQKGESGKVQIIKKSLTGDIDTFSATISGDEITIEEYEIEKDLTLPLVDSIKGNAKITVNTTGRLYDNTIIFNETYSGLFYESGSIPIVGTIKSNNIVTVAKLNE